MAVFRVEKTKDYTIMSNHHLKDRRLSLKAKGLLSMMLSLPKEWDYSMISSVALAGTHANSAFSSTEVALSASMYADFTALTTRDYPKITVSVTLQRKDGSSWIDDRDLPAPVFAASNTAVWGASKDYSDYGTSGETYRIKAVFDAEGVTATAYSVSRVKI